MPGKPEIREGPGLVPGDVGLRFRGIQLGHDGGPDRELTVTAVPYFEWANRGVGPMRIWVPRG